MLYAIAIGVFIATCFFVNWASKRDAERLSKLTPEERYEEWADEQW